MWQDCCIKSFVAPVADTVGRHSIGESARFRASARRAEISCCRCPRGTPSPPPPPPEASFSRETDGIAVAETRSSRAPRGIPPSLSLRFPRRECTRERTFRARISFEFSASVSPRRSYEEAGGGGDTNVNASFHRKRAKFLLS